MQPDALRRLARLIEDNRLSPEERREWALILRSWAMNLEQEQLNEMDEAIRRLAR